MSRYKYTFICTFVRAHSSSLTKNRALLTSAAVIINYICNKITVVSIKTLEQISLTICHILLYMQEYSSTSVHYGIGLPLRFCPMVSWIVSLYAGTDDSFYTQMGTAFHFLVNLNIPIGSHIKIKSEE